MNSVDEAILKAVLNLLDGLESAVRRAREEIARVVEEKIIWQIIEAERPVDPTDRAMRWLERKLAEIKGKHPELLYEFTRDHNGLVTGLRYRAPDTEVQEDVEAVARWAFEKAVSRPVSEGNKK
ncbi:MAG: hypothetical protein QXG35_10700 [Nitrososphaerota archaeon]